MSNTNDKTAAELKVVFDEKLEVFRSAQRDFDLKRAELLKDREQINRLRNNASKQAEAVEDSRKAFRDALYETDGDLTDEVKEMRRAMRDARDLEEDLIYIAERAENEVRPVEFAALNAASNLIKAQTSALNACLDFEIRNLIERMSKDIARVGFLADSMAGNNGLIAANSSGIQYVLNRINAASSRVERDAVSLPDYLIQQCSVSPIDYRKAISPISILKGQADLEKDAA